MHGKVLVVEDDESVRRLLVEVLQGRPQIAVESARDGVEALHQISTTPYDVIVLDVMMPMMSGVDFLDSLQALTHDRVRGERCWHQHWDGQHVEQRVLVSQRH